MKEIKKDKIITVIHRATHLTYGYTILENDYYLLAKKLRYQLISSRDSDHQSILQSDWIRDTPGLTQPWVVVSYAYLHDKYFHAKSLRYHLIPSTDNISQRILQFDWTRSTPGHAQPTW